jgi:uncharacterized membrane protein
MLKRERIFQAVLFEVLALTFLVVLGKLFINEQVHVLSGLALVFATIAMVWNYIYNIGFDRIYGTDRINRTIKVRVVHSLYFEIGMLIFTLPIVMWVLDFTFIEALILDLVGIIFFLIYTPIFHYIYDHTRVKFKTSVV